MADIQAIITEFQTNPASMPYLAFIPDNAVANAEIINNSNGSNPRTVNRDTIQTADIRASVTYDAFDGLTASEESWLRWATTGEELAVTADTLAALAGIGGSSRWAAADRAAMEPRIAALMQYQGSRAEEIKDVLGASSVSPSEIRDAASL